MSRDINSEIISNLTSGAYSPFFAVKASFDTQELNLWTGIGDINIAGLNYTGAGSLLEFGEIQETSTISATGITIALSGVPSELLSLALQEKYQGRELTLFFGITDQNRSFILLENGSFVLLQDGERILQQAGDPAIVFKGYIDQMTIDENPKASKISLSVESRLIDLERSRVRRYTNQDQKTRFPNDRGLEFLEDLQDKQFKWGRG